MLRGLGLCGVEELQQRFGHLLPSVTEQEAVFVAQGQNPREVRRHIAAHMAICALHPGGSHAPGADRRSARSIRRQQALQRGSREAPVATGSGEDAEPSGVTPAAEGGGRHAEDPAGLGERHPIGIRSVARHRFYSNLSKQGLVAHCTIDIRGAPVRIAVSPQRRCCKELLAIPAATDEFHWWAESAQETSNLTHRRTAP